LSLKRFQRNPKRSLANVTHLQHAGSPTVRDVKLKSLNYCQYVCLYFTCFSLTLFME